MISWHQLLFLIICSRIRGQFNLYNTNDASVEGQDCDCLHYFVSDDIVPLARPSQLAYQIIVYCRRPGKVMTTDVDVEHGTRITFEQLREDSVRTDDLFVWAASIDVIESYQAYLNNPNAVSGGQFYYNCSSLWFGSYCQYTFDSDLGFTEIVKGIFSAKKTISIDGHKSPLEVTNLTCYVHLNCHRGLAPVCLDWREVCDGKVDCLDGGSDEQNCPHHVCDIDEYRCQNGLCIPESFVDDDPINPDCTDWTDEDTTSETMSIQTDYCYQDPAFRCEERKKSFQDEFVCGDGQETICSIPLCEHNCRNRRDELVVNGLFSYSNHPNLSYTCWSSVMCLLSFNYTSKLLPCENTTRYIDDVQTNCPRYFLFPNGPIYLEHFYFIYSSNRSRFGSLIDPDFICFDNKLTCNISISVSTIFSFNGLSLSCFDLREIPRFTKNYISWRTLIIDTRYWTRTVCSIFTTPISVNEKNQSSTISISFGNVCNGYVDVIDNEHNMTDETDCNRWLCDNIYTRCDTFWDCPNGADEANCLDSLCPPNMHPCVSSLNYTLICLPLSQANNGIIDCMGSYDERTHCRQFLPDQPHFRYRCHNSTDCTLFLMLCAGLMTCPSDNKKELCENTNGESTQCKDVWDVLNGLHDRPYRPDTRYFALQNDRIRESVRRQEDIIDNNEKNQELFYSSSFEQAWLCNRGIPVYTDREKEHAHCLCPQNYYGDRCQYQNERVSLTVQFRKAASRDVWHTVFRLVVFLQGNDSIESYEEFVYASMNQCSLKHNIHLLYRNRSKQINTLYSIRIDAFVMSSLTYHSSWYLSIPFPSLPVNRLVALLSIPIEAATRSISGCQPPCSTHGQCLRFANIDRYFCRCDQGWSGVQCSIAHDCSCSSNSLCIGSNNNRSICVCPLTKFGPRCLLTNSVCQTNPCDHDGVCIPNEKRVAKRGYICICKQGFSGVNCEITDVLTYVKFVNMPIPMSLLVHFITVFQFSKPKRTTIFKKIPIHENTVTLSMSGIFHLIFVEIDRHLYLTVVEPNYTTPAIISTRLTPAHRCLSIQNLFNDTVVSWILLRRIKDYHVPCQEQFHLQCFYDEIYLCLCTEDRQANCFEFDHNMTYDCHGNNYCENGAQCFQDHPQCPRTQMCMCPECYFGWKCQLSTNGFGLSLDAILGYEIRYQKYFYQHRRSVIVSAIITTIMLAIGLINSILVLLTFYKKSQRQIGCGIYLFSSSISSLLAVILCSLKFWFLVLIHTGTITNRTFILFQCISMDFLTRSLLILGEWLYVCVSIERTFTVIQGINFDKMRSKQMAKWILLILLIFIISTMIQDPIHRHLIDDFEEKRTWCVVTYPPSLDIYNSAMITMHLLFTFSINITSTIIIIFSAARRRTRTNNRQTYRQHLQEQLLIHKHIIISPCILVLSALPRLILSFMSGCMKSARDPWLFLISYFVSFISPLLVFPVFVLPSKLYRAELNKSLKYVRKKFQQRVQI